jgi:diaminopimelate decarboxylase
MQAPPPPSSATRTAPVPTRRLLELAREYGTPHYVYDLPTNRRRIAELAAFDVVRYAMKANSNLSLLRRMREGGVVVDAVSAGEILRALAAGYSPAEIVYSADLFDRDSAELVRRHDLRVNVGSTDMLPELARLRPACSLTLRVNPGFGSGFAPGVTTGGDGSKHGIWHEDLDAALKCAGDLGLRVDGLHIHIGSGIDLGSLARTTRSMAELARRCGPRLRTLSAGGGIPVPYRPRDTRPDLAAYACAWVELARGLEAEFGHALSLETEPGRYLVAESGLLLTELRVKKRIGEREFWIVDAGFQTLARPMLYDAWHHIEVLGGDPASARSERVVAGPLCEAADVLTTENGRPVGRLLPDARVGDLLCLFDVGAYGASMASTYNSRPLPAEILVDGEGSWCVRRRQALTELFALELEEEAEKGASRPG